MAFRAMRFGIPAARAISRCIFFLFAGVVVFGPLALVAYSAATAYPTARYWFNSGVLHILGTTLTTATLVTACCIAITAFCVVILRARPTLRTTAPWIILVIPLLSDQLSRNFGWYFLLRANGLVNAIRVELGLSPAHLLYRPGAVIAVMTQGLYPLALLPIALAYQRIGDAAARLGRFLGARRTVVFWRIEFPLTAPGWFEGAGYVFCSSFGYYITPRMLGGDAGMTIAGLIDRRLNILLDWDGAALLSLIPLAVGLAGAALFVFMSTRERASSGFAAFAEEAAKRAPRLLLPLALLLAFLPLLPVFSAAFSSSPAIEFPPRDLTLRWIKIILFSPDWSHAWVTSIESGLIAVIISVLAGAGATVIASAGRAGLTAALAACAVTLLTPPIVAAVGLYRVMGVLQLQSEILRLGLGQAFRAFPFVAMALILADQMIPADRRRAILVFGGPSVKAWLVAQRQAFLMPLGIGTALGFLAAFFDLEIALFISGPMTVTIPMRVWAGLNYYVESSIAAAALLTTLTGVVTLSIIAAVARRSIISRT